MSTRLRSLKGRKTFQEVFKRGKRLNGPGIRIIVLRISRDREISVSRTHQGFDRERDVITGITINKKFGTAVERNRMKRRIRSVFRELLPDMDTGTITVAHVDAQYEAPRFTILRTQMSALLRRAGILGHHETT